MDLESRLKLDYGGIYNILKKIEQGYGSFE